MEIEMDGEEDVDELYGDLYEHLTDGRQVPKTSLLEMEERMDQLTKQGEEMHLKIQTLQKQYRNSVLSQDCSALQSKLQEETASHQSLVRAVDDLFTHTSAGQSEDSSSLSATEKISKVTQRIHELKDQNINNNSLQEEKDILICNISSLFKTAQMEIGRKNKQINELRQEISQLKIQEPCSNSLIPATVQMIAKSEKLLHDKQLNEVQNKNYRETRHAGEMQGIARISQNDSKGMKNISRDEATPYIRSLVLNNIERTVPFARDAKRPKTIDVQARTSEHVNGAQNYVSHKGRRVNGKEECSFEHDRLRGCQSREKLIEPKIDSRNDHQIMHMQKKDSVNQNPIRHRSSRGSVERKAEKTILGNPAMKSIGDCDILSGDGNCIRPRNSVLNRKVIDAADTRKLDSYSEDPSRCRIQKRDYFVHSRNDKKPFRSEDSEQSETHKLLGKQYKNDSGEDKNFGNVQVINGFESRQDHGTRSWMNEAWAPEHGNKAHLSETTGPERLSFMSDETHEDCREEVQTNGEQRRKRSKDSELPEIMGADKGDIWSSDAGTHSHGVGHVLLDDSLQNTTVIKGQLMQANGIKSSISLPEVKHTDSTVLSFGNGDGAEAGFKLQLGVDETSKDLGMSRELNAEMPKEAGAINFGAEEMKDSCQGHHGESMSGDARKFRVSPFRSREKRHSKNILQRGKEVMHEKKERCFDLSFSRKRGIEEMKGIHTHTDNGSRQAYGNICNDHGRKSSSFSSDMDKKGRRGHAHQVQARNGFESGQDLETGSWMNEARVPEHGSKAHLSKTTGPESLSFISDETHEVCREQRREMSKDSKLSEIVAADKGDIWSSNDGTYSREVGHVLLDDSLQNTTVINGQGTPANNIKSSISLPEVKHTDSTVYSFGNGDGAEAGFKLQLGLDETSKDLVMSRELNAEMPKEAGAINYVIEEMKGSFQRHHRESISEEARNFRVSPDRSREKQHSKNILQHGKEVKYEKKERCFDLSFSKNRGMEEMKDIHTNKNNDSRQGYGNISNDRGRKYSSFSSEMDKKGRRGHAHQVQARNGFESGQDHETGSWMNEARVPEHGSRAHLSKTMGTERLSFISDETHEDCREWRRKMSKDSKLPEIVGADIWSSNDGTYPREVGHVLLDDILQNTTVIEGQGTPANYIKSSISLREVNHTESPVYSFVNGDGAEAGFKLQLGVDETPKYLGMSRESNVEMSKEAGATDYRAEEMKESSQRHHGESIYKKSREFRDCPDRSREKQDRKNILQHGKEVKYEKKEGCSDLSFSRKRGIEEMEGTDTNKGNGSWQGNGNISNDHGRKTNSFSLDMNKQGRRGHAHQVQARNGFESGQDHETRSLMNEARVPEHDNKAQLSETMGPERLSSIPDETREDCREEVQANGEQRRKSSKESELPEIFGADKGDIWSSNAGTYSCEVGQVPLEDSLQNTTVIKGQGMQANNIKSSISLPALNHTDSTVYSFANEDGAEAGFKLQLGVDEVQKDLGMSRELNVEMQKEFGATSYRAEEVKDSSQIHRGESNSETNTKFGVSPDRSREMRDSKNILQCGKEVKYEKNERYSDLLFKRKRGTEEMKDTHTSKGNDSRQGNHNISNDHSRKNSSVPSDLNKQGRRGHGHQVIDLGKSTSDKFDPRRQYTINGEKTNIQFSCADGARDEAMTKQGYAYSESRRSGRDILHKRENFKTTSRSEHHGYGAERDKYKRRDRCGDQCDNVHKSRKS